MCFVNAACVRCCDVNNQGSGILACCILSGLVWGFALLHSALGLRAAGLSWLSSRAVCQWLPSRLWFPWSDLLSHSRILVTQFENQGDKKAGADFLAWSTWLQRTWHLPALPKDKSLSYLESFLTWEPLMIGSVSVQWRPLDIWATLSCRNSNTAIVFVHPPLDFLYFVSASQMSRFCGLILFKQHLKERMLLAFGAIKALLVKY